MILSCNSCDKKFVVPDNAIGASGRLVQCSSCGNKWKQLPINTLEATQDKAISENKEIKKIKNIQTNFKTKKKIKKNKKNGPNLYSPEYLVKKHGINIKNTSLQKKEKFKNSDNKISFGFYNSLFFFIVVLIFLSRSLYFVQEIIVKSFPSTGFYLNYFFETIKNIFEITKNLITYY